MTERVGNSTQVKPLTKRKKETNELYFRRSEVESQIERILSFENQKVFGLIENRRRESADYLLDETIVYLLRERGDDNFYVETLYAELSRRTYKLLRKFYKYFSSAADFEDFAQNVEMEIIKKIFDSDSNAGDYAQVNFGDFVVTRAKAVWRGRWIEMKRENEMYETERGDDEGAEAKTDENRFVSGDLSVEEKMVLRARLAELPENIRTAAILHYLDGWQIESSDERQPTVSKFFSVSSRTIRNWFAQAKEILSAQEGDEK